jgi:hypothetical protein
VEPLITDTAGVFSVLSVIGVFVSWGFVKWLILRLCPSYYPIRLKGHPWLTFSTSLAFRAAIRAPVLSLSLSQIGLYNWSAPATSVSLAEHRCYYEWELYWAGMCYLPDCARNVSEKWNVMIRTMSCVGAVLEWQMGCVYCRLSPSFFNWPRTVKCFRNR